MATNKGGKVGLAVALATAIAIPAEGLRRIAYYDPPGILTVCYGSTSGVIAGKRYTMDECKARLDKDMLHAVEQVDRCAPNAPPNVLAAFGDAAYNMGPRIAGVLVPLPGLTARRAKEMALCLTP